MPFQRPGRGVLNMSAKARSRIAVQWLPVVLFLGFVAVSVLDTNATAASKIPAVVNVAAGGAAIAPQLTTWVEPARTAPAGRAPQPIVIAALTERTATVEATPIAAPVAAPPQRSTIAPLISSTPAPAP